jgi:diguanylate cyclase (GGDEF)-like protein
MFNEMLRHAIEAAGRHQRQFALLFIDLDRFKVINDSLGHDAGDMLLVQIADRLRVCLRSSDVVARLGGDEFVVLVEEISERGDVERAAADVLAALARPMQLRGHECHTTASIGIAMYPSDGSDAQELTKNADMAMYLAKEDGKNGFRFLEGDQDAVDRTADAGERASPRARARAVPAALSAEDRHGERADHRRRGAVALDPPRSRPGAAGSVHSARRGNRDDRADRPLGA